LKLDSTIKERVQRLASARRRSPHWIMREAVELFVEREEKREQLRQDALAAWADYQTTGLHVTAEEPMPGWPSSRPAKTRSSLNATFEVVPTCPPGHRPSPSVFWRPRAQMPHIAPLRQSGRV
jgi:predicted transcriptional regulator